MKLLFLGLGIFSLAFILHLVIWKLRIPRSQTKVLLVIFSGVLISSIVFLEFIPLFDIKLLEYLHLGLLYICLALAYTATYSAIEADSPTLVIVDNIAKSGSSGITKEKLYELVNDDILVKPRIKDLLEAKMVYLQQDKYKLSPNGRSFIKIFILYRNLLRLGKGG